jgi:hypothetical protein
MGIEFKCKVFAMINPYGDWNASVRSRRVFSMKESVGRVDSDSVRHSEEYIYLDR